MTDGSLGARLRKLEDDGYLAIEKTCRDRRPVTWYALTEKGRSSLRRRVANLARLIERVGQPAGLASAYSSDMEISLAVMNSRRAGCPFSVASMPRFSAARMSSGLVTRSP